jgi:hypothetical protein
MSIFKQPTGYELYLAPLLDNFPKENPHILIINMEFWTNYLARQSLTAYTNSSEKRINSSAVPIRAEVIM